MYTVGMLQFAYAIAIQGQTPLQETDRKALYHLIDQYSLARENKDTVLLKRILTPDIDQLVSTGEWRTGIQSAVKGMLASSATRPGTRKLIIEKIKLTSPGNAIIDCRYEILNDDGTVRKMWSTFMAVSERREWQISAIRNMVPAGQ